MRVLSQVPGRWSNTGFLCFLPRAVGLVRVMGAPNMVPVMVPQVRAPPILMPVMARGGPMINEASTTLVNSPGPGERFTELTTQLAKSGFVDGSLAVYSMTL